MKLNERPGAAPIVRIGSGTMNPEAFRYKGLSNVAADTHFRCPIRSPTKISSARLPKSFELEGAFYSVLSPVA